MRISVPAIEIAHHRDALSIGRPHGEIGAASPVDLDALWKKLGIQRKPDGSIEFVPSAPQAKARDAITRPEDSSKNSVVHSGP